ncbi:MAG TPA: acyl-CoA dehydrogenase family protein [Burkholderiaceae bacterium]|nr:acyl-CoA dehydrogenase family protein [Burkholderiaceae bacterium]
MELRSLDRHRSFRREVREWLDANLPPALREKFDRYEPLGREELQAWHRVLAAKCWAAPHWRVPWGAPGGAPTRRFLFEQECGRAGAPPLSAFGLVMCASVLLRFGTEAQKARFLPPMYRGDEFWCQGYSEPGAGSDLASLSTRAERVGDHYVVNGQKTWTSFAHIADWMFALVRTDPDAPRRQEGISFLLIDMKSPGLVVRPLVLMDGSHEVNEVFFDNVKVPVGNRVGDEHKGWTLAKMLLGFERANAGRVGYSRRELDKLKRLCRAHRGDDGRPLIENSRFRDRLTRLEAQLMALEVTSLRFLDEMQRTGKPPGPDVGMVKIVGTRISQDLTELMMEAGGDAAHAVRDLANRRTLEDWHSRLAPRYANFRKTTIFGGSTEVQYNIFAQTTLGL